MKQTWVPMLLRYSSPGSFLPKSDHRFSTAQVGTGKSWEKSGDPPTDHLFAGKLPSTKRDPRPAGGVDM